MGKCHKGGPRIRDREKCIVADNGKTYSNRPNTRGECEGGDRPCQWIECRYHLGTGAPDESCVLDVADRDGVSLEEVAIILGLPHEQVRQIEEGALEKAGTLGVFEGRPLHHALYPVRIKGNEDRMRDILIEAAPRGTAMEMGKYLGCSFVSVYSWIKRFFGCSFWEFKRQIVCKSDSCAVVETGDAYSRDDYLIKKIRAVGRCACCDEMPDGFIMTNASFDVLSQVVVSCRITYSVERLDEKAFMIVSFKSGTTLVPTPGEPETDGGVD